MLRVSLTAAALSLAILAGCGGSEEPLAHSCVATDQKFIAAAMVDVTAFNELADGFRSGSIEAEEIALEAFDAAARVGRTEPKDPALRQAQKYLDAMFTEYGEAVTLHVEGKDPGERMYRAYGLANFARDVLAEAQPALQREGCDVAPLL
ncbi:MAG TPA: hypothetical protein VD769_12475 [Gaiellaceae bacterium]|nr:hypothetical protein [Gaiellaceae bacterium]